MRELNELHRRHQSAQNSNSERIEELMREQEHWKTAAKACGERARKAEEQAETMRANFRAQVQQLEEVYVGKIELLCTRVEQLETQRTGGLGPTAAAAAAATAEGVEYDEEEEEEYEEEEEASPSSKRGSGVRFRRGGEREYKPMGGGARQRRGQGAPRRGRGGGQRETGGGRGGEGDHEKGHSQLQSARARAKARLRKAEKVKKQTAQQARRRRRDQEKTAGQLTLSMSHRGLGHRP